MQHSSTQPLRVKPTLAPIPHCLRRLIAVAIEIDERWFDGCRPALYAGPITDLPEAIWALPQTDTRRLHAQALLDELKAERKRAVAWLASQTAQRRHRAAVAQLTSCRALGARHSDDMTKAWKVIHRQPELGFNTTLVCRKLILLAGYPSMGLLQVVLPLSMYPFGDGETDETLFLGNVGVGSIPELTAEQRWEMLAQTWEYEAQGSTGSFFNQERIVMGLPPVQVADQVAGGQP